MADSKKRICLFDIDGTLTKPRNPIEQNMIDCLHDLRKYCDVGLVGGSDEKKIRDQIGQKTIEQSNYFFSENGLIAYKGKQKIGNQYLSSIDIPIKRGNFIEYRTGMINISPIGRNCSQKQRDEFEQFDKEHEVRKKFIEAIRAEFPDLDMVYSIGGQISFDCMPKGWDKTFCLQFLTEYDQVYFFGDKTHKGGNDHEIYEKIKQQGRAYTITKGPDETIDLIRKLFMNS